ncbi:MAG: phenylpyruvate tautomerase MIF-related protein [Opitutales bacterium]
MPSLTVQHNTPLDAAASQNFANKLCTAVAQALGKDPQYMLVSLHKAEAIAMGTASAPAATFQLDALGLTAEKLAPVIALLTDHARKTLGTAPDRVHIIANDIPRTHWGFNGQPMA